MPRPSLHGLIWCEDSQQYELRSDGKSEQWFRQGDEQAFACWLAEHTAFSFVGRAGRLSVRKEGRGSGRGYWYAYRKQDRRIRKGYLGPSAQVTFARLEEQARSLASSQPAPSLDRDLPNAQRRTIAGQPHNVDPQALAPVLVEFFTA
jgi:LuxR family maltose regulon positive regulatory protein